MGRNKVIYISGPIMGVPEYYKAFEAMEEELYGLGYIPLSPSRLPGGLSDAQFMRIRLAMIDSADAVILLSGWSKSVGARFEKEYCLYTNKKVFANLNRLLEVM